MVSNPIVKTDCPDPDVIRVDDTYYMVNTTMYFMPGCEILRSYDLANWEHVSYVYDTLDSTPAQRLCDGESIYGQGMWAASLRYNKGTYYIVFVANDTKKTYLYTSSSIEGPWKKSNIEGFYHDCSLLFDDDRVFIAYGNREIYITELLNDLSGPKPDGLHRMVVKDTDEAVLGYEGTHFYKINGKYYLFFIHSAEGYFFRKEACFVADSLEDEFKGQDILIDDMEFPGMGIAQGPIVDTPDGKWYAILFQDSGAVGRMPILMPMHWENDFPVISEDKKAIRDFEVINSRPDYKYRPLVESDDFKGKSNDVIGTANSLKPCWQFNHEPDLELLNHDLANGTVSITTDKLSANVTQAKNTLTQRMMYPFCEGEIILDYSEINEGDYAGLVALQGAYAFVGVTKESGQYYVVMVERTLDDGTFNMRQKDCNPGKEVVRIPLTSEKDLSVNNKQQIKLRISAVFEHMKDEASLFYDCGNGYEQIGHVHKMGFRLDHFTGVRFGLFIYSTKAAGGRATFANFRVNY